MYFISLTPSNNAKNIDSTYVQDQLMLARSIYPPLKRASFGTGTAI